MCGAQECSYATIKIDRICQKQKFDCGAQKCSYATIKIDRTCQKQRFYWELYINYLRSIIKNTWSPLLSTQYYISTKKSAKKN